MSAVTISAIDFRYINLAHREDRRKHIESECSRIGVTPTRFNAITPHQVGDLRLGEKCLGRNRATPGRKACYASHYSIIKNHKSDKILGILEDDAIFCSDFNQRFDYLVSNFPEDWDMFFLNAHFHLIPKYYKRDFELTTTKHIAKVYGLFCAHAYLINPKSVDKILSELDRTAPDSYALDYSYILMSRNVKEYCYVPGMSTQLSGPSDIDRSVSKETTNTFRSICGPHTYTDRLTDFNYEFLEDHYV